MIKYYEALTNTRGDILPGYRVQVATSAGSSVSIYADSSGTPFTDSSGNAVSYTAADTANGRVGFWFTPAAGHVLQITDSSGNVIDSIPDFADKYLAANGGAIAESQVTGLTTALAAKAATADLGATTGAAMIGTALGTAADALAGAVGLDARTAATAAATKTVLDASKLIVGTQGATYSLDTTVHLTQKNRVLRGNGATIYSANADVSTGGDGAALTVGCSTLDDTQNLTKRLVVSFAGPAVTLDTGLGSHFAVGDAVLLLGNTSYTSGASSIVPRNSFAAHVKSVVGDVVTLDRNPPLAVINDTPVNMLNLGEGVAVTSTIANPGYYYWCDSPVIENFGFVATQNYGLRLDGVLDGRFRNIIQDGRNGIVANALHNCLIENVEFRAYNKTIEIAQGSYATTLRGIRGYLWNNGVVPPFGGGIDENSAHCTIDDAYLDYGFAFGNVAAFQLTAGHDNEMRNSTVVLPYHVGTALGISNQATAGGACVDSGYRNVRVEGGAGLTNFWSCNDLGGGITRPYAIDCRFSGTVSGYAFKCMGTEGTIRRCRASSGGIYLDSGCTNWTIEDTYTPSGFVNLTKALLKANPGIRDNESAASRRLSNASYVSPFGTNDQVTTTTAQTVYASATFAAGDLKPGDVITVFAQAYTYTGTTARSIRPSFTSNGTTSGITTVAISTANTPIGIDMEVVVVSDTKIVYRANIAGTWKEYFMVVSSLDTYGLTANLEYWCASTDTLFVNKCHIVARKPGMKHPPLR